MSGRRQIGIILFCLLSCISWSQTSLGQRREVFSIAFDSMIRSQGLDPGTTGIIADSGYRSYINERWPQDPSALVLVEGWAVGIAGSGNQQIITASGSVVTLKPPKSPQAFTISRYFPHGIDTSNDDEGFWDSVLQPALVTLGAVAIVALFFLVRS